MASAPLVKPSAPELRAHQWPIGTQLAKCAKLIVDVGTSAKVHSPQKVVQSVAGEIGTPVALEELHLVEAALTDDVPHLTDVSFVFAVAAVFVLDLHHDDRSSLVYSKVANLFGHLLLKLCQPFDKKRILLAQPYVLLLEQPPW